MHTSACRNSHLVLGIVAFLAISLQACDSGSDMPCPNASQDFFEKSIKGYLERNPGKDGVADYKIVGRPTYDSRNNWWGVPFESKGKGFTAILGCDGHLEISVGS